MIVVNAGMAGSAVELVTPAGLPVHLGDLDAFTDGWLANRRLSPHTRDAYRRVVTAFLNWCLGRELELFSCSFV
jgi:integrase/recombinase XerD